MTAFSSTSIAVFVLVLVRVSALVAAAPIFGAKSLPTQIKVALAVMVSLIFTPLQVTRAVAIPPGPFTFGMLVGREALIGLAVGYAVALVFTGVQVGSHLIGIQMGFGLGGIINPDSGADSGAIDSFFLVLATVIFLAANGHHAMLAGLSRTFEVAPVGGSQMPRIDPAQVLALVQAVLAIALRIAMPVIGTMIITDVAIGLVARAAPGMEVMVLSMPVKISVGLLMLAASAPMSAALLHAVFANVGGDIARLFTG